MLSFLDYFLFAFRGEFLVLDSDVIIIGAAPGNVAESVILERDTESTVMFVEGKFTLFLKEELKKKEWLRTVTLFRPKETSPET